jgi:serine 3-dehydrogenase
MDKKVVLITGASSGIGKACAEVFAEAGYHLILLARRQARLEDIASELKVKYGTEIKLLSCDIRKYEDVEFAYKSLPKDLQCVDVLINNAGLARGIEKIQNGVIENWEEMIDTNIKGLLYITRLILPSMVERNTGHIVNIASIAGLQIYPGGNVYCSTKAAVKMISEALIMDLNGTKIRITNIDPGLVKTEFAYVRYNWDIDKAKKVYENYKPLDGKDVAEIALFAVQRPAHVNIQEILVTPVAQATTMMVNKEN